jgi:hypothetical protein
MPTKQELLDNIKEAKILLNNAEYALEVFEDSLENNTFTDMQKAEYTVYDRLEDKARKACEGSYCYGDSEYVQEFIVNGVHYIGTLSVDYNRHDKTYYYVDGTNWSVVEKVAEF